eukprot:s5849_g5.t1
MGGKSLPAAAEAAAADIKAEVHARWAKDVDSAVTQGKIGGARFQDGELWQDMVAMEDSVKLMQLGKTSTWCMNVLHDCLDSASADVSQRDFLFDAGDHDMRGCFTFVSVLGKDSEDVWHVLRSWLWLRNLEVEALNYEGHERCCVRSTALLALGVFNLFVSMLPPTAMKAAGWATGFAGGRDVALAQLQSCWEEGGIQAPFAGLVLIGFFVDVSSFLGELRVERNKRHTTACSILDWAKTNYPSAFFFKGLESGYLAANQDLEVPHPLRVFLPRISAMEPDNVVPEPPPLCRSASVPSGNVVFDGKGIDFLSRSHTVQFTSVDKLMGKSPVASKGVLLRTSSGYEVALVPPEHLRELQCSVCGDLIQSAVHAPCGHSFCQVHLQGEQGSQNELEIQATRLRELTVHRGFSVERARQALAAVGEGSLDEAAEMCEKLSGLEGRAVRVRPEVKHPKFEWGAVSHSSVGVVLKDEDTQAWVSFAEQSSWHCQRDELEIDPVADQIRPQTRVRIRAGVTPKRGWGLLQVDGTGTVVTVTGCQVRVLIKEGAWSGFINELEVVDETRDMIEDAAQRLKDGKATEDVLAQLHAILLQVRDCSEPSELQVVLTSRECGPFINSFGAFAMLRAVGLQCVRHAADRTVHVFGAATGVANLGERTASALQYLEKLFETLPAPKVPQQKPRYRVVVHVDADIFAAGVPVQMVYQEQLRSLIIPAIAPQGEGWSWPQRGWAGEEQMVQHLQASLPAGKAELCREQEFTEASKVAKRLEESGLVATVEEGSSEPLKDASMEVPTSWTGSLARGSRVRFRDTARSVLPSTIDPSCIGLICDQVFHIKEDGSRELQYFVCLPKSLAVPPIPGDMLDAAPPAERIQPGVRIRVNPPPGKDPAYGWGRIASSDVGIVQQVHLDGKVDVFFMSEEKLWHAALQDLDTENLPMTLRPNCPVCQRPFPSGQQLNLDIAMDSQIRRMKKLMAGARHERNGLDRDGGVPRLLRSQTHREELKCNICFDLVVSPVTLPCGHTYCKHHIQTWLLENDSCPVCRVRILHFKDREKKPRQLRTAEPLFQTSLRDEDGKGGQQSGEGFELHVNKMLETQVIRFFQDEVQNRISEVASEVWDVIERRQDGFLTRLRNFLDQFRAPGVTELLKLKNMVGPDSPLPNTKGATLLMMACELGLEDTVEELLKLSADPWKTTSVPQQDGVCQRGRRC